MKRRGLSHRVPLSKRTFLTRSALAVVVSAAMVATSGVAAFAAGLPAGPSTTGVTGLRPSATRIPFSISDRASATVDVGTGNLNLSADLLDLPGVAGSSAIGIAYNSLDTTGGENNNSYNLVNGWAYNFFNAGGLSLQSNGSTVDFTDGSGAVWPFAPVSGSSTAYTSPSGLKATLTKTATGWTLYYLVSSTTVTFDSLGEFGAVTDRNGNAASLNWSTGVFTTSAGTSGAHTASGSRSGSTFSVSINGKTVSFTNNGSSNLVSFQDPTGATTQFTYSGTLLTKILNPNNAETDISYDSSRRVTEVDQLNSGSGAAGTSTTRFAYVSTTETDVAGPNTSTSVAVSTGPHVTYTVNASTQLVTQATDQMGRVRAATFNANLDALTSTVGSGSTASTTTGTYGANSGVSLTQVASQTGATSQAAYANTGASSQYLPSSTTDSAGNQSTFSYDGAGNQLSAQTAAVATQAIVTRNTDGTVATATAAGNGSNVTSYSYTNHQLTGVTPPTGTSLGSKANSYDSYGRLATATDGAGRTTSYSYDLDDRLLTESFSDSTPTVTNTYDASGNLTQQVSGGGTITNTYDALNHLLTTGNTAGGGTITYGYDKAGNQTSLTDGGGTTTNGFDNSGVVTRTTYPKGSGTAFTNFATNSNGQRTDEWIATNSSNSTWAGHVQTSYDGSGRVSRVTAQTGTSGTPTTVIDVSYCYNTAGSGTSCGTTTTNDRSKLQRSYDALAGQTTSYSYDGSGRLTGVAQSGGSGSNNSYAYTYNANGDRLTATVTGSSSSSQTLTYNAANQITTTGYSYDGAGNLTATPTASFTYNAAEQMTSTTTGGHTYHYVYAGASQTEVLSAESSVATYTSTYGRADPQGNPELLAYKGDNTAYLDPDPVTGQANMLHTSFGVAALYVYDGIGNPVALLADYVGVPLSIGFDPYGIATISSGSTAVAIAQNPYSFKSGIQDRATGFVKFGQRWYNPTTGAWTQQDTLDAPLDPTNANRYAYAGDDPVNLVDARGSSVTNDIAALFAGIAAGLVCEAITAGVGTVVCGILAGLLILGTTYALNYLETGEVPTL